MNRWRTDGYDIFIQNPMLLAMLKTTAPKILAEATTNKLWGTGISLRDPNILKPEKWSNTGWMSRMLTKIRDEN